MTPTMPTTTAWVAARPTSAALAPGLEADPAARHPDQQGEGDAFDEAEHEWLNGTAPMVWYR